MARQPLDGGGPLLFRKPRHADKGGQEVDVAGQRPAARAGLGVGMGDDERHVGVGLVAERPLALEAAVGAGHLAVVGGEDDRGVLPQVHLVHRIDD